MPVGSHFGVERISPAQRLGVEIDDVFAWRANYRANSEKALGNWLKSPCRAGASAASALS
jgi:hypothetical protein